MTFALRISTPTAPPTLAQSDLEKLVALPAAAALLKINADHLSRQCRERLEAQGAATFAAAPDGGQPKWWIRRDYDPRLIGGDYAARFAEPDLSGFTLKQQQTARARQACVAEFRKALATWPGQVRDWLPCLCVELSERFGVKVKKSALYAWQKKYQRPADLDKLIDTRGGDQRAATDPAAWDAFRDLFLHENRPAAAQCWETVAAMARENGWRWCSLHSCRRQLDTRIPPEIQLKHRDPAKWRQSMRPYIAQDPEAWAAGECWIGDHKQLDLICRFNDALIRPWLTAWKDWRTRRVVGWVLSDTPNSTTILGALHHGLNDERNFGGPRAVWIDNGRDYDAWVFHGQTKQQRKEKIACAVDEQRAFGIFNALQIEPHFSIPFNPNGKSRLERWFRTLERFFRTFPTYTGDAPDSKPEALNKILATAAHRVPTFEGVYDRLFRFIAGDNASADHSIEDLSDEESGERLSADQAMARWCQTRHVMRDPASLDLLLMQWQRPVTVGRNGITLMLRGRALHYGQFEAALTPFKAPSKDRRRPVLIAYDPHDLRSVRVHDEQFRYVCTVHLNSVGGMHGGDALSIAHVTQLSKNKATYEKSLKHVAEHSLTQCLTTEEQLADVAARAPRRTRPAEQPPALRIRQTPIDGQAEAIERDQLRVAVGAESQSRPASRALPSPSRLLSRVSRPAPARAVEPFVSPLSQLRERRP